MFLAELASTDEMRRLDTDCDEAQASSALCLQCNRRPNNAHICVPYCSSYRSFIGIIFSDLNNNPMKFL